MGTIYAENTSQVHREGGSISHTYLLMLLLTQQSLYKGGTDTRSASFLLSLTLAALSY